MSLLPDVVNLGKVPSEETTDLRLSDNLESFGPPRYFSGVNLGLLNFTGQLRETPENWFFPRVPDRVCSILMR